MRRLVFLLLLAGCVSPPTTRDVLSDREKRLMKLEDIARIASSLATGYECEWQAAQGCAELADEESEPLPANRREEYATLGLRHADRAIKLAPTLVEGHFYRCMNLGRYLEVTAPPPALLLADLRDEAGGTARLVPQ